MKIKYIKNLITTLFLLTSNVSCYSTTTISKSSITSYENTNFIYLSHNQGVDLLYTQGYRITERFNEGENSGKIAILNYGRELIINNIGKKRLDIYLVLANNSSNVKKTGEISLTNPVVDLVFKNDEAYIISENKITFVKADNNSLPQISGSLTFDQSKFSKAILSKDFKELFIYDSAKQEFLIIDTKQKSTSGYLKINQDIAIGGLDIDTERLFFTDENKSDVYVYDLNKKEIIKKIEIAMADGEFSKPSDLKVFKDQKIYVVNKNKSSLSVIDYKSLEIIKEIINQREDDKINKISLAKYPDLSTILLVTCDCNSGFYLVNIDKDRYKFLGSTGIKMTEYEFISLFNPLMK